MGLSLDNGRTGVSGGGTGPEDVVGGSAAGIKTRKSGTEVIGLRSVV